jgi:hypothetical protein
MENLELEAMRREVELRYGITLEKGDPMLAVMAVTVQIVSECLESMREQNFVNHKIVMNELQKVQADLKKSYPRLKGLDGVGNSSNVRHS